MTWEQILPYLLLIFVPLVCDSKTFFQSALNKRTKLDDKGTLIFVAIISFISAAIISACFWRTIPDYRTVIYGVIFGILSGIYQFTYMKSLMNGPTSITAIICNMCIILPVSYSFIFLNESVTIYKIIGTALILITLIFLNFRQKNDKKPSKFWIFFVILAFLSAGFSKVVQAYFNTLDCSTQNNEFLAISFITTGLITLLGAVMYKPKLKITYEFNIITTLLTLAVGITLAFYNVLVMISLSHINGSIFFPVTAGLGIILFALYGIIFNKERINIYQTIGIISGIIGIVLVNLKL